MTDGFVYIATGEEYINEAKISVSSVRDHMPKANITLITDENVNSDSFDNIKITGGISNDFSSSNLTPDTSPYERTVFLDTDTYIADDISELFSILDEYDIAVAPSLSQGSVQGVPSPMTQFNTGVVSYRSNESVHEFFNLWNNIYSRWRKERDITQNQPSFLRALYDSDVDFFTLPYNYNLRLFAPAGLHGQAKIIHGRPSTGIENAAKLINNSSRFRAVYRNSYLSKNCAIKVVEDASYRYHLEKSLAENGVIETILKAPKYIKERII